MSQGRLGLMPKLWINNKGDGFRERSESNCCGLGRPPKGGGIRTGPESCTASWVLRWAFPCSTSTLVLGGGDSTHLTDEARQVQRNVIHGPCSHRCGGADPRLSDQAFPFYQSWRGRAGPRGRVCLVGAQLTEV